MLPIIIAFFACDKSLDNDILVDETVTGQAQVLSMPDSAKTNTTIRIVYESYGNDDSYTYLNTTTTQKIDSLYIQSFWRHLVRRDYPNAMVIVVRSDTLGVVFQTPGFKYIMGIGRRASLTDSIFIYN